MKSLALVFFLSLAVAIACATACAAAAYPIQGNNGLINCTIFGTFKDPGFAGHDHSDSYSVLVVDACLTRTNRSDSEPILADYSLTDGNDRVYSADSDYIKELSSGRRLIGFVVPKETIAKSITIDLSRDPTGGMQFSERFPELLNKSDERVRILYYGVLRSVVSSNKKTVELDVAITNNDSKRLAFDADNFTLRDQWGWTYASQGYDSSSRRGLKKTVLEPNATIRSSLFFPSLSPLSRPSELVYSSNGTNLTLNIDTEAGLLYAAPEKEKEVASAEPAESTSSLAGSIKASKSRLTKVKKLNSSEESTAKGHDEL